MNKEQIARLEGAVAAASPDKMPLAEAALAVAKSAYAEIETLRERAEEAESLALQARPVIENLAKRAGDLEEDLAVTKAEQEEDRRVIREDIVKRETIENNRQIAKALQQMEKTLADTQGFLMFLVKCTRYTDTGRSVLGQITRKYGEIEVLHPATGETFICESKAEAVKMAQEIIKDLEAIDKAEDQSDLDRRREDESNPEPAPTTFPTGAVGPLVDYGDTVPGLHGTLDGRRLGPKKKKKPRIL